MENSKNVIVLKNISMQEIKLEDVAVLEEGIQPGGLLCGLACIGGGVYCGVGCPH
ncbi:hypothetical protein [Clostridium luticellarii]|jgi:hypothetical protein|uniref:Uncharacterized protein n=1 Tax=Clostridium luticellarii TaxID=1691940 RepID=A0A2T0B3H5_9CLOT|nr:hypothetical protein [Clostridium luticellarii]PRR78422.1 hypothetical protein CLLU_36460 [Clostridium luticellarii]